MPLKIELRFFLDKITLWQAKIFLMIQDIHLFIIWFLKFTKETIDEQLPFGMSKSKTTLSKVKAENKYTSNYPLRNNQGSEIFFFELELNFKKYGTSTNINYSISVFQKVLSSSMSLQHSYRFFCRNPKKKSFAPFFSGSIHYHHVRLELRPYLFNHND